MRVLLLGASGMLGRELAAAAPAGVALVGPDLPRIELTDRHSIERAIALHAPDAVLNAAAYTRVDDAERDGAAAHAVNAVAVGALADACARRGTTLVHFSTDYVFDGRGTRPWREDDAPAPINRYGASKREGELLLAASGAPALVLRTQWLFGAHGKSFPRTMWERARASRETRVVVDQTGRPTHAGDLARATWALLDRGARGIVHVANDGVATWYDLARAVFAAAGRPELVAPCTTADYPTPASRPAYSVLDTSKLETMLGAPLPRWEEALTRFLAQLREEETATAAK